MRKVYREYNKSYTVTKKSITIKEYLQFDLQEGCFSLEGFGMNDNYRLKSDSEITKARLEAKNYYAKKRIEEIQNIVECNQFYSFLTITFDEALTEQEAKYEFKKAKQRLVNRFGKFKYIARIERGSENERVHMHLLTDIKYLSNFSRISFVDKDKKVCKKKDMTGYKLNKQYDVFDIYNLVKTTRNEQLKLKRQEYFESGASYLKTLMAVGHVKVDKVTSIRKCVNYIVKYMGKELINENSDINSKSRQIWTSTGLEKAIKITDKDVQKYIYEDIEKIVELKKNQSKKLKYPKNKYNYFENDFVKITQVFGEFEQVYYNLKDINIHEEVVKKIEWYEQDFKVNVNAESSVWSKKLIAYADNVTDIINKYDFLECLGNHDYKEYLHNIEKKNIISIQRMTFRYEMKLFNSLKAIDYIKEINKDLGFKKINHRRVIL